MQREVQIGEQMRREAWPIVNKDFADFFALLNQHGVEFLIIGGVAYNFHAPPRATMDIDVWVRPKRSNLEKPVNALGEFGLPTEAIDIESWA